MASLDTCTVGDGDFSQVVGGAKGVVRFDILGNTEKPVHHNHDANLSYISVNLNTYESMHRILVHGCAHVAVALSQHWTDDEIDSHLSHVMTFCEVADQMGIKVGFTAIADHIIDAITDSQSTRDIATQLMTELGLHELTSAIDQDFEDDAEDVTFMINRRTTAIQFDMSQGDDEEAENLFFPSCPVARPCWADTSDDHDTPDFASESVDTFVPRPCWADLHDQEQANTAADMHVESGLCAPYAGTCDLQDVCDLECTPWLAYRKYKPDTVCATQHPSRRKRLSRTAKGR